jgi:hypothetical protein
VQSASHGTFNAMGLAVAPRLVMNLKMILLLLRRNRAARRA